MRLVSQSKPFHSCCICHHIHDVHHPEFTYFLLKWIVEVIKHQARCLILLSRLRPAHVNDQTPSLKRLLTTAVRGIMQDKSCRKCVNNCSATSSHECTQKAAEPNNCTCVMSSTTELSQYHSLGSVMTKPSSFY